MIRDDIKAALVAAMKARDERRVAALRMIQAALKNRDIEARTGAAPADDDVMVAEVLSKMAKQRRESIELYIEGKRPDLADIEHFELNVIESFLPQQLSPAEAQAIVRDIITEMGATSIKDMGRVMAVVKERFAGQVDMAQASMMVKQALAK